jgi:hypothetical protein
MADDMVVDMIYVLRSQTGLEFDRSVSLIAFRGRDQVAPVLGNALYGMSADEEHFDLRRSGR